MPLASLDEQAAQQFTRDFESLFNTGDAAGMAAFYAEDAKLLAEGTELIRGRGAIEEFWRHAIDEVTDSGDLGYALGTIVVRIPHGERSRPSTPPSGSVTPTAGGDSWLTPPARILGDAGEETPGPVSSEQFFGEKNRRRFYGPGGGVKMAWVPIRRQMTCGWPGIRSCP